MRRGLDFAKAETAFKRAAEKAVHGTREERSGRFLVSSTIKSVEYDEGARELDITFTSGKRYRYFNVPLEIYAELLDAGSKGKFFNDNIKGAFAFAEVGRR
jgi:KTSC domain